MKALTWMACLIAAGAVGILVLSSIRKPGNDEVIISAPAQETANIPTETPVLSAGNPPIPPPPAAPRLPLPKNLVMVCAVPVRTSYGDVTLARGLGAELVRDDGETIIVQWQKQMVRVPRDTVLGGAPPSEILAPAANPPEESLIKRLGALIAPRKGSEVRFSAHESGTLSRSSSKEQQKRLVAMVTNLTGSTGPMEVTFYWVARKLDDESRYVHHADSFAVNLGESGEASKESSCPVLQAKVDRAKLDGWIVILKRGGKMVSAVGSTQTMRNIAGNETQFAALVTHGLEKRNMRAASLSTGTL